MIEKYSDHAANERTFLAWKVDFTYLACSCERVFVSERLHSPERSRSPTRRSQFYQ